MRNLEEKIKLFPHLCRDIGTENADDENFRNLAMADADQMLTVSPLA
jgi:hypothetical protein